MNLDKKIFIAGHNGMVGSAVKRRLDNLGYKKVFVAERSEVDLLNQNEVRQYLSERKFDEIYLCAAKVGGILANNSYPADFIYENLMIQTNVIFEAFRSGTKKLLFLGSSCIYPKEANQPIKEEYLLSDKLEPTNEPYAIAKISGIKLCESLNRQYSESHGVDYRSIMPTNLFGPGDYYHPTNSHVIPALIQRFHDAKINRKEEVEVWGSGSPLREFMFVDDLANACEFVMSLPKKKYYKLIHEKASHINIGSNLEVSIKDLSMEIAKVVDFKGKIIFDTSKPDGTKRKLMCSRIINELGWQAEVSLEEGLKISYEDFLKNNQRIHNH